MAENQMAKNKMAENKMDENKMDENKRDENKLDENQIDENKMSENKMSEDKRTIFLDSGGFGPWNYLLLCLSSLSSFLAAFSHLSIVYLAYPPTFNCSTVNNQEINNNTCFIQRNEDTNDPCLNFTFDQSIFTSTVVTEYILVCERSALLPTLSSAYFLGIVFSILITGLLSDYLGRRKLILISSLIHIIASWTAYFSQQYAVFLIARMFLGGSIHSVWAGLFILVQETTPVHYRTFTGGIMNFGWNVGALILCALAYFIRDWRNLQLSFAIFSLTMISYFFFVPESPRWLLSRGRIEEARSGLIKVARMNKVQLESEIRHLEFSNDDIKPNGNFKEEFWKQLSQFSQLVTSPQLRTRVLLLAPTFFAVGMGSYGIHFAARLADLNLFAVTAVKEIANFLTIVILIPIFKKVQRTRCLAFTYFLAGFVAILFLLVPSHVTGIRAGLLVIAQALFVGNYFLVDTYAPEILPTPVRSFGFNLMDAISKCGTAVSPYIVDLGGAENPGVPPAVFGSILIVSSLCFYFLPETKDRALPSSAEELEIDRGESILRIPRRKKRDDLNLSARSHL